MYKIKNPSFYEPYIYNNNYTDNALFRIGDYIIISSVKKDNFRGCNSLKSRIVNINVKLNTITVEYAGDRITLNVNNITSMKYL